MLQKRFEMLQKTILKIAFWNRFAKVLRLDRLTQQIIILILQNLLVIAKRYLLLQNFGYYKHPSGPRLELLHLGIANARWNTGINNTKLVARLRYLK